MLDSKKNTLGVAPLNLGLIGGVIISISACGESGGGSGTQPDEDTSNTTAQLSCSSSGIWGPIQVSSEALYYVSEPNGMETPRCAVFWEYNVSQNCSNALYLADSDTVELQTNGSMIFTEDGVPYQLQPANVSVEDLSNLPDCTIDTNVVEPDVISPPNDDTNGTNTNGATFGYDLPQYQDLVLISRRGLTSGLDGLSLSTIKQVPVIRFADGSATRDLTKWLQRQNPFIGRWSSNSDGTVTTAFDGGEYTSIVAPNIASRTPRSFYQCYKKVNTFSLPGSNSLNSENYCFSDNGAFSNDRSGSFTGSGAIGGGLSQASGSYEVDGNVIRLTFNDGTVDTHVFGTYIDSENKVYAVSIGESVYNKKVE